MKKQLVSAIILGSLVSVVAACADSTPDGVPTEAINIMAQEIATNTAIDAPITRGKTNTSSNSILFPRNSHPFGVTYEQMAIAWWQWALAMPAATNPMAGGPCDQNQSSPVFFLAGTNGGASERSCTIPTGRGIFFPIVNFVMRACPEFANDSSSYTCAQSMSAEYRQSTAEYYMAGGTNTLLLEVDGVSVDNLEDYRAYSDGNDLSSADPAERFAYYCSGPIQENPCGIPVGTPRPMTSDGYWAMLRPLSAGAHDVRFAAALDFGTWGFSLDVTYHLTVE